MALPPLRLPRTRATRVVGLPKVMGGELSEANQFVGILQMADRSDMAR